MKGRFMQRLPITASGSWSHTRASAAFTQEEPITLKTCRSRPAPRLSQPGCGWRETIKVVRQVKGRGAQTMRQEFPRVTHHGHGLHHTHWAERRQGHHVSQRVIVWFEMTTLNRDDTDEWTLSFNRRKNWRNRIQLFLKTNSSKSILHLMQNRSYRYFLPAFFVLRLHLEILFLWLSLISVFRSFLLCNHIKDSVLGKTFLL